MNVKSREVCEGGRRNAKNVLYVLDSSAYNVLSFQRLSLKFD